MVDKVKDPTIQIKPDLILHLSNIQFPEEIILDFGLWNWSTSTAIKNEHFVDALVRNVTIQAAAACLNRIVSQNCPSSS